MNVLEIAKREILEEMAEENSLVVVDNDGMIIHE